MQQIVGCMAADKNVQDMKGSMKGLLTTREMSVHVSKMICHECSNLGEALDDHWTQIDSMIRPKQQQHMKHHFLQF